MSLLYWLSYLSIGLQGCFVTIAIAAGLYYLAELVEEYTVAAKKIINSMILVTIFIYILSIFFERFSWTLIFLGLFGQLLHLIIMKNFPYVKLTSIIFILSIVILIINHYMALRYFAENYYNFTEVMAYFTLCLWLVPFALFVSLSANDNVLPVLNERVPLLNDNDVVTNYFSSKGKKLGLLSFFNYAKETILPQRNKKSF